MHEWDLNEPDPSASDVPAWMWGVGITPEQWIELYRSVGNDGERKLVLAVIDDAVRLAAGDGRSYEAAEARRWLLRTDGGVFSFRWCCEALGIEARIDPAKLRRPPRRSPSSPSNNRMTHTRFHVKRRLSSASKL